MGQLPAVDQLPDGISIDEKSFKFKDKIFHYDKIKSIRIYSGIQKMSLNLIPMPTTVNSILTVFDKDNKKLDTWAQRIHFYVVFLKYRFL